MHKEGDLVMDILKLEEAIVSAEEKGKTAIELLETIEFLIDSNNYENIILNMSKINALIHVANNEVELFINDCEKSLMEIYKSRAV